MTSVWLVLAAVLLAGCAQEMGDQPSYRPLEGSDFFSNGQAARPLVPGTVPRGYVHRDVQLYEGKKEQTAENLRLANMVGGPPYMAPVQPTLEQIATIPYVDEFPFPITSDDLKRGQQQFTIYCSVCHGGDGEGNGIVVQRGFTRPPTYHSNRLRKAPVGYFFDVITHGLGSMPDYAGQVPAEDRWRIVAYIRALQLSRYAVLDDLPPDERQAVLDKLKVSHRDTLKEGAAP